jgi:hypothetical protein
MMSPTELYLYSSTIRESSSNLQSKIWQLNEHWPTGGWGVIEYGTEGRNHSQVVGGRWKPLMHLLESSLFRDVIVACGKEDQCYVRNDGLETLYAVVSMESWALRETQASELYTHTISLKTESICE